MKHSCLVFVLYVNERELLFLGMYRYISTSLETKTYDTDIDEEKIRFVRLASKYLFIYQTHHDTILIEFQLHKYKNTRDPNLIREMNLLFQHAVEKLVEVHAYPLAIVLSDTHLNVVQFLFPFVYNGSILEIGDNYKLRLANPKTIHTQIIHLGDYGISQVSRIYKEKTDIFKPLNDLMIYLIKQLYKHGMFLAGNHDFFINKRISLMHHCIRRYGDRIYLFIHGPPLRDDLPEKQWQFKDRLFYRYNRKQNGEWNKVRVDNCFKRFESKILQKYNVIVCGHENNLITLSMPDTLDRLLVQYDLIEVNMVCLDAASATRAYFSFESPELDHPYLEVF